MSNGKYLILGVVFIIQTSIFANQTDLCPTIEGAKYKKSRKEYVDGDLHFVIHTVNICTYSLREDYRLPFVCDQPDFKGKYSKLKHIVRVGPAYDKYQYEQELCVAHLKSKIIEIYGEDNQIREIPREE